MRFLLRKTSSSVSRSTGSWLTLLLLFVVLVPSIGLLWFLNQAVEREQFAARQQLTDAYRAQLIAAQARFEENWRKRIQQVSWSNVSRGVETFHSVLMLNLGDAAIVYDQSGNEVYPTALPKAESPNTTDRAWTEAVALESSDAAAAAVAYAAIAADSSRSFRTVQGRTQITLAARALQAQARCLIRIGDHATALSVLEELRRQKLFARVKDPQGRAIVPNAALLAAELLSGSDPKRAAEIRQELRADLYNYQNMDMPSSQARFLLRDLERDAPDSSLSKLLAAEDLAAAFVAAQHRPVKESGLRPSPMPGIWQYSVPGQWYVTLHREENLQHRLRQVGELPTLPEDIRLEFIPPGHEPEGALLTQFIGVLGWRLGIVPTNPQLQETATTQRIRAYTWIVALLVVSLVIVASLAWNLVRRQIALTRLRSDLVANVTHELKTPIASTRLLVETLLNAPQLNEQTTREYLQLIASENLRLSRLIGNFLTFSRIERNKHTFSFQEVAPSVIAQGAAAAVRDRMPSQNCQFEVSVAADLPRVRADADAMITALVNLLDNAWKYSSETKTIALTAVARNGSVAFAVRDRGIGLAPGDTQRIFRRFEQIQPSQPTGGGGVGLGLSIVQYIVSAHRGTVSVESESGRGSVFTITLPAAETAS